MENERQADGGRRHGGRRFGDFGQAKPWRGEIDDRRQCEAGREVADGAVGSRIMSRRVGGFARLLFRATGEQGLAACLTFAAWQLHHAARVAGNDDVQPDCLENQKGETKRPAEHGNTISPASMIGKWE